jgi:hypothetical protein
MAKNTEVALAEVLDAVLDGRLRLDTEALYALGLEYHRRKIGPISHSDYQRLVDSDDE